MAEKLDLLTSLSSKTDKDYLARIFRKADQDFSGKLNTREFRLAYDILFDKRMEATADDEQNAVFCRAVRYGRVKHVYLYEVYEGDLAHITRKSTYNSTNVLSSKNGMTPWAAVDIAMDDVVNMVW